jgi:hypothetical protein
VRALRVAADSERRWGNREDLTAELEARWRLVVEKIEALCG